MFVQYLQEVYVFINQLSNPETRENALLELSKKRESVPDLAVQLWHSFGTIAGKFALKNSQLQNSLI